ncbi:MAG: Uncharacterized protein G01um101466_301 [Parcubacteria group bacterium Gr01-1014_66]|nr:MAG: Uncharacterized protein G01um101466_301 [Parcubacteria group bacterium Gr01-1014_66]
MHQKDIEVTPALREYIDQKIVRSAEQLLNKRQNMSDVPLLDIEVERTTQHHQKGMVYRVGVKVVYEGKSIRTEATHEEVHAACDLVEDEMKRKIIAQKSRGFSLLKRGARRAKQYLRFHPSAWFSRGKRERNEGM